MVEHKLAGVLQQTKQVKLAVHNSNIVLNSHVSRKRKNDENQDPTKSISRDSIYEDPPTPAAKRSKFSSKADCAVQTDLPCCDSYTPPSTLSKDLSGPGVPKATVSGKQKSSAQDVLEMLTSDEPGERYWEMVASERKVALLASLTENKELHKCNSELQQQVHTMSNRIEHLQTENTMLESMLSEAKKLAELVEAATEEASELQEDVEVQSSEPLTRPVQEIHEANNSIS